MIALRLFILYGSMRRLRRTLSYLNGDKTSESQRGLMLSLLAELELRLYDCARLARQLRL